MKRSAVPLLLLTLAACATKARHNDDSDVVYIDDEFERRSIIDHLEHPVGFVSAVGDELVLADGSKRTIPRIEELVVLCPSIRDGVDIGKNGDVFALMPIHHWCGNDSVGWHTQRMPVGALLAYIYSPEGWGSLRQCISAESGLNAGTFWGFLKASGIDWDWESPAVFPGQ